jgi:hypothetical protein
VGRDVLLVGSVGLANSEDVFRTAAEILGEHLPRIPDGETGFARSVWIQCQTPFFLVNPALEMVEADPERPGEYREARIPAGGIYSHTRERSYQGRARLRKGVSAGEVRFSNVGYGDWASESYGAFKRLKSNGVIPPATRFQVCIPSPRATLGARVLPEALAAVAPAYEAALAADIRRLSETIPKEELAIQWDCTEPVTWNRMTASERNEVIDRLVRIAGFVPEGVELGYHLCYGDFEHQHGRQPPNAGEMVEIMNAVIPRVARRVSWVHMPVPRDRADDAYFAALEELALSPETRLYLGLIHNTDGAKGARRRIPAANKAVGDFGSPRSAALAGAPGNRTSEN